MSTQPSSIQAVTIQAPAAGAGTGGQPAPAASVSAGSPAPGVQKTAAGQQATPEATPEQLKQAVEAMQRRLSTVAPELQFSIDKTSGRSIITVTDPATNQVIQQIPSETALRISKEIDHFQGMLLNRKG